MRRACFVARVLRQAAGAAHLCVGSALLLSSEVFEREPLYQAFNVFATTLEWAVTSLLLGTLLVCSPWMPFVVRQLLTMLSSGFWMCMAILVTALVRVNPGTGVYGFMFLVCLTAFARDLSAWLDGHPMFQRFMVSVRAHGDRRQGNEA